MKINKSELIKTILDLFEKGYTRFQKDETTPGHSVQTYLSNLAGANLSDTELKGILAYPELKAKKAKVRVFDIVEDETGDTPNGSKGNVEGYSSQAHATATKEVNTQEGINDEEDAFKELNPTVRSSSMDEAEDVDKHETASIFDERD